MKKRQSVEYEDRADKETGMASTAGHLTGEDNVVSMYYCWSDWEARLSSSAGYLSWEDNA